MNNHRVSTNKAGHFKLLPPSVIGLLLCFVFLSSASLALNECKGNMNDNEIPCIILLPINDTSISCSSLTTKFYLNGSIFLYEQSMYGYSSFMCNSTFNQTSYGTYSFLFSTGDSGSIVVTQDVNNVYYLYVVALIIFIILIWLGYWLKESIFVFFSGLVSILITLNLVINGFPNLTNYFLKISIVVILAGLGFFLMVAPFLKDLEDLL